MKEATFLKYARKVGLGAGVYYNKSKKKGTLQTFMYSDTSHKVVVTKTTKGSEAYKADIQAKKFRDELYESWGRKTMKDVKRAIKKDKKKKNCHQTKKTKRKL